MADNCTNHTLQMQMPPINVNATSKRQTVEEEEEDKVKREGIYMIDELMEEILIRLPVKSLLRLKATCKSWCFLIKSPSFIDLHKRRHCLDYHDRFLLSRQTPADDGLVMYSCAIPAHNPVVTTTPLFDLGWFPQLSEFAKWTFLGDDEENDEYYRLLYQPCTDLLGPLNNGIYLHVHYDCQRKGYVSVGTSKFALCNIATREYKFLNPFPSDMLALLSNLAPNPCQAGYGFGTVHNKAGFVVDYKVVLIVLYGQRYGHMLSFVYSLRRGSWDKIADVRRGMEYSRTKYKAVSGLVDKNARVDTPRYIFNSGVIMRQQAFLNGYWHWLDVHLKGVKSRGYDRVLVFDVANEVFNYFQGPPHDYTSTSLGSSSNPHEIKRGLFLLSRHLAMIYMPHDVSLQNNLCCVGFDVWMMMDYGIGESWTKIYSAKPTFNTVDVNVLGIRYSTCTININSPSSIHIHRIFLHDNYSGQLVSWDGSQVTEHGFYMFMRSGQEILWNAIGISPYVVSHARDAH